MIQRPERVPAPRCRTPGWHLQRQMPRRPRPRRLLPGMRSCARAAPRRQRLRLLLVVAQPVLLRLLLLLPSQPLAVMGPPQTVAPLHCGCEAYPSIP